MVCTASRQLRNYSWNKEHEAGADSSSSRECVCVGGSLGGQPRWSRQGAGPRGSWQKPSLGEPGRASGSMEEGEKSGGRAPAAAALGK